VVYKIILFQIDDFCFFSIEKLKSPALTMPPLFHLTFCTCTKSNLYLANSLAAAVSEPALYRPHAIPSTKSHVPLPLLMSYYSTSPDPRLYLWIFCNIICLYCEELLAPRLTPNGGGISPCLLSMCAYSIYSKLPFILEVVPQSVIWEHVVL
jgi:hypothetical protein